MGDEKLFESKVSYVMGLASIVFAFLSPIAGLVLGILGLTTSKGENTELGKKTKKLSKIGITISVIILILFVVITIYAGLNMTNLQQNLALS